MNKCERGHYYDENKFSKCPVCDEDMNKKNIAFLECIFGTGVGKKYSIHEGLNRIGTGCQMDIHLTDDIQITRDNHCTIVYDIDKDKYKIVPSTGSFTYLNNVLLRKPKYIHENDVFRIGRSNFRLVRK